MSIVPRNSNGRVDPGCAEQARKFAKNKESEIIFHQALNALAAMCQFTLTEDIISIYDRALAVYGYQTAVKALQKEILTRKSKDPFPSVSDLLRGVESGSEGEAIEVASKVWDAVSRFGWTGRKPAVEWVGPVGSEVIDRVGWPWLCEQDSSAGNTIRAQLRDIAKAIIERKKSDTVDKLLLDYESNEPKALGMDPAKLLGSL